MELIVNRFISDLLRQHAEYVDFWRMRKPASNEFGGAALVIGLKFEELDELPLANNVAASEGAFAWLSSIEVINPS